MNNAETFEEKIQQLSDAVVEEALVATDYAPILTSFCDRLVAVGMPLFRVQISTSTLHPLAEGVSLTWRRGSGLQMNMHEHGSRHRSNWMQSPLKRLLDSEDTSIRFNQTDLPAAARDFPLIAELREEGLTDYLGVKTLFSDADTAAERRDGLLGSFATDAPGGFTDAHIKAIHHLLPKVGLISKLANRQQTFINVLEAYLGPDAGHRVMEGQIALGTGDMIDAVIWFCDLRGSVTLAEKLGHQGFIELLNAYFEALAGSVLDSGGQVLRFIGDAALAIFPITEEGKTEGEAKADAMRAAKLAIERAAAINQDRKNAGLTPFEFGIGLHIGRIMFGNIGVPSRVEFSVIGPAANEAARIEGLCKSTGEVILVSEAFRTGSDLEWRDLGVHKIRGSSEMRLFAPQG